MRIETVGPTCFVNMYIYVCIYTIHIYTSISAILYIFMQIFLGGVREMLLVRGVFFIGSDWC